MSQDSIGNALEFGKRLLRGASGYSCGRKFAHTLIYFGVAFSAMTNVGSAWTQILDSSPATSVIALDDIGVDLKGGRPVKDLGQISIGAIDAPAMSYSVMATSFYTSGTPVYVRKHQDCVTYAGITGCIYSRLNWQINGDTENMAVTPPSTTTPAGYTEQGSIASVGGTITRKDGTTITFGLENSNHDAFATSVSYANGEVLTYSYNSWGTAIVSNRGYMLRMVGYTPTSPTIVGPIVPSSVVLINLNTDYCSPTAATCGNFTKNWPSYTITTTNPTSAQILRSGVDTIGRTSTVFQERLANTSTTTWPVRVKITSPTGKWFEYQNSVSVGGPANEIRGVLAYAKTAAGQWNYNLPTGTIGATSTAPDGIVQKWEGGFVDGLGRKTAYGLAGFNMYYFGGGELGVASITKPEGNRFDYTYDIRHNLTQTKETAKVGSGTRTASAVIPTSCVSTNIKICNLPTATIDARGNQTDYTYDAQHGGVLTKTLPADANGVRPQTRYTYQQLAAKYKMSAGAAPTAGAPIWMLTQTSKCQTLAVCTNSTDPAVQADEIITAFTYNDNLLPIIVTTKTGTGVLLQTVSNTYDEIGNLTVVDGPLAGTDDATYYFYDDARQKLGEIDPDPDGTGVLARAATRITYNLDGQETKVEKGTVTVTTLAALQSFVATSYVDTTYDALGHSIRETVVSNGVIVGIKQYSYDIRGRVICTAIRMNLSITQPADACTPATTVGEFGPDRVSKNTYDAAGQLTAVQHAYSTTNARVYARYTYTGNGLKSTEADANNNLTTYSHNEFDQVTAVFYPTTTVGAMLSNAADYDGYGFDLNNNRTSWRRRDGQTFTYTFDKLNREVVKNLPGTTADVYTGYDLFGRVKYKRFVSTTGVGVSYSYDGLGRMLSTEDMNGRTITYAYNLASVRIGLVFPDSKNLIYARDKLNRLTDIHWSDGTVLVRQGYNNLGLRASLNRGATAGSGGATSFGYDNVGRLTSLAHNLDGTGTAHDITWSFSKRNPANQIVTWGASTAAYDYVEAATSTVGKAYDGLNRDATIAAASGYDLRGNVIKDETRVMTYDLENRLLTVANISTPTTPYLTLSYDPEGRLTKTATPLGTTEFLYDTGNLIGEYTHNGASSSVHVSDTLAARYVHGDGIDEPLVWFEGTGVSSPKFLFANHQGSIIAYASSLGAFVESYHYDPYGLPTDSTGGTYWLGSRFRYTGQIALADARLYYYKARVYDPIAGRFLQTDPVGSSDDLDLYAYAGGDPINRFDSSGSSALGVHFKDQPIHWPNSKDVIPQFMSGGHSATVLINDKTGATKYYEFGRYGKDGDSTVRQLRVPDLELDAKGVPTSDSLNRLFDRIDEIGGQANSDDIIYQYNADADFDKMEAYVNDVKKKDPDWNIFGMTCHSFCSTTLGAGGGRSDIWGDNSAKGEQTLIQKIRKARESRCAATPLKPACEVNNLGE